MKKIIIFLSDIVAILYYSVKKLFAFLGYNRNRNTLRILVYHSVSTDSSFKDTEERNISLDLFKQQMLFLKRSSKKILDLNEGIDALKMNNLACDSIAITFDDGLADVYNNALSVLENLNIPATFFIIYKYIDNNKQFLKSDIYHTKDYMDWPMIDSLDKKGFEIGSHSNSHRRLSVLKDEELDKEIRYTKKEFEKKGIPVKYFAYPYGFYGNFSNKIEILIKESGYKACFTNIMGDNDPGENLFRLKRTRISWRDNIFRYKMKINGAYDWIDALKYLLSHKNVE